jgi:hypothetical protein
VNFVKTTWFIALALLAVVSSRPLTRFSQDPTNPIPLWSAEALQEEFTPIRNPLAAMTIQRDRPGVVFLDENRIVVYEVDSTGKLSSRLSPEIGSSFQLHASVFTSDAGRLVSTIDWPTRAHYSSIQAIAGGLLIRTGDKLTLISKNLGEIAKFTLPNLDRCTLSVSATQRTILSNCLNNRLKISQFDVLDGNTLASRYSWTESPPLFHQYSISDTEISATDVNQSSIIATRFASRVWKPIGDKSNPGCVGPQAMITDDQLVAGICNHISVLSTVGQPALLYPLDKGRSLESKIAVSLDGRLMALSSKILSIKKHVLSESDVELIGQDVAVYDLSRKKRVLMIDLTPLPKDNYDFALSPDGSKLAVLNDRRVSVYSVPTN